MESPDLNLLVALDALLRDNSVTDAATRLHTSPPAMSRALGRLRRALDDPLLVRAGRDLVRTPRAEALEPVVHALVEQARAVFGPSDEDDPAVARRVLDLRAADVVVDALLPDLVRATTREAPGITLRFRPEPVDDDSVLREGDVDLEIGQCERHAPEIRVEQLADLPLVALVRPGHPLLEGLVTPERFARAEHVVNSRRGRTRGPVDDRLAELGLSRRVVAVVPTFAASAALARTSDVVCLGVDGARIGAVRTEGLQSGLVAVDVPLSLTPVRLAMAWHPRHDADRVHGWLRASVRTRLSASPGGGGVV